ncbi:glycosyltransferase [Cryobacterium soli]|uniref:glycosyltransferase n=1 Tax=Cryobacterium soli TaxID=2220095 RepID=UPI000E7351F0|nr:glycosyltransferase [Cryobacterium soli]
MATIAEPNVRPGLSLIMTVLNEEVGLHGFLQSLGEQSSLPSEIVIVDGGSTDKTMAILRAWQAPRGVRLVFEVVQGAGISEGRNRAISLATSEKILVTDAGTTLDPGWVENLSRHLGDFDVVSGFFEPHAGTFLSTAVAATITPHVSEIAADAFLPSSRSVGFLKSTWARAGGYPEWLDYCEDLVFDQAMKADGATFRFVPTALVTWDARPTLRAFAKQYFRYARGDGKARLWKKRHIARYSAYAFGVMLIVATIFWNPASILLLIAGGTVYLWKFYRRLFLFRNLLGRNLYKAILLLPIVVVIGDVAKMLGYPAGLMWLRKNSADRRIIAVGPAS